MNIRIFLIFVIFVRISLTTAQSPKHINLESWKALKFGKNKKHLLKK